MTTCQKLYESIAWTETSQWEIFKEVMKNKPSNRQLKENLSKLRSLFNKFRDEFFEKVRWLYSKKDSLDKSEFIKKENLLDRRKCRLKQLESVLKQWEDDLKKEKEKESQLKNKDKLIAEDCILKDLYYLTGYILEAFTIYLVYAKGGFSPSEDVRNINIKFSQKTHVDFFKNREKTRFAPKEDCDLKKKPEELKKKREELKKKHEELLEALKKIKLDAGQFFNIEEHEFWKIITNLFRKPNGLMLPSEQNIPIICQKHEDRDMESLVKEWNTNLRYSTEDDNNTWNKISLNPERLKTLMDLCVEIKNHPCYKF